MLGLGSSPILARDSIRPFTLHPFKFAVPSYCKTDMDNALHEKPRALVQQGGQSKVGLVVQSLSTNCWNSSECRTRYLKFSATKFLAMGFKPQEMTSALTFGWARKASEELL